MLENTDSVVGEQDWVHVMGPNMIVEKARIITALVLETKQQKTASHVV
jgi:hypothetical protein